MSRAPSSAPATMRRVDANRRLLVLGAGRQQLGLLAAARSRSVAVVAVDRDPSALGFRLVDRRALISFEDEPAIHRLAARLGSPAEVDLAREATGIDLNALALKGALGERIDRGELAARRLAA